MPVGRVLLLTSTFPRWSGDDVTPFVWHLVEDLCELGWEVGVLAPHDGGAAVRETLHGARVRRFRYALPARAQTLCYRGGALINLREDRRRLLQVPGFVAAQVASLARMVRGYDLIHAHWILPQGFSAGLVGQLAGVPVVTTVHGGSLFGLRGGVLDRLTLGALSMADVVTVNSSVTRAAVEAVAPALRDVRLVHIGAEDRARPLPEQVGRLRAELLGDGSRLLIFVGRMVEEKGVADLLAAMPAILRAVPGARLALAGSGQDLERFQEQARALGLGERVRFAGWVDPSDVPSWMAAGDVFIGPSKRGPEGWVEAQGITFAEAMLAGTPVVATRSGGIVDAVRHEETGLLVSEGDPDGIAAAVVRILSDPSLAAALSRRGAAHARAHFTRSATAARFSELFKELLC